MCIPNELFNEILDQLGEDHEALRACSCVCQSMRDMAQRRLFRKISLVLQELGPLKTGAVFGRPEVYGRPEWFLGLVESSESAHIAEYVVHLEIHQMSSILDPFGLVAFRKLIRALLNVSEISFPPIINNFEHYDRYRQVRWTGTLQTLLPELDSLVKSSSITKLDVVNVEPYPIFELRGHRRLERLALGLLHYWVPTTDAACDNSALLEVDNLVLHKAQPHTFMHLIDWLSTSYCNLSKSAVRRLEIKTLVPLDPFSRYTTGRLIDDRLEELLSFFSGVEVLYLVPNPDVVSMYKAHNDGSSLKIMPSRMVHPTLGCLVNLRTLTIQFELYTDYASYRFGNERTAFGSSLEWVACLLKTIPPPTSRSSGITRLNFVFEIKPVGGIPQRFRYQRYYLRIPEWVELVDVLLSERFPALREVDVQVSVPDFVKDKEKDEIRKQLSNAEIFASLRSSGIFVNI